MKRLVISLAVCAVAVLALGIRTATVAMHPAADGASDVVSYDSQGVTVAPPGPSTTVPAPVAATAQSVMDSFRSQQVPAGVVGKLIDTAPHSVDQAQVTETMPVSPEVVSGMPYAAWVVTYPGLPAVSYAPAPPPAGVSCTFVGVMNRATGDWTEFFSSCS